MGSFRLKRALLPVMLAAMLSLGFVASACSDDDDGDDDATPAATAEATADPAAAEVEAAVEAAFAAWGAKDVDALVALFTDEGLVAVFGDDGETADDVKAGLPSFIGDPPITNPVFSDTGVDGTTASTDATYNFGALLDRSIFTLVDVSGEWKISDEERDLAVAIPPGTTELEVGLVEFTFDFDPAELAAADDGVFALHVTNSGQQQHELVLARLPAEGALTDLLASEDPEAAGFEFIGGKAGPPADEFDIVLVEPLEPGRYAFICFFPDTTEGEDGTPHALKGMATEFAVD